MLFSSPSPELYRQNTQIKFYMDVLFNVIAKIRKIARPHYGNYLSCLFLCNELS